MYIHGIEKSSLIKRKLLPFTEKSTHLYFVVDVDLLIFDTDTLQFFVFPRFVLLQCNIRSKQAVRRLSAYGNWLLPDGKGSQLTFGEATCKPKLRHGHVEDIHLYMEKKATATFDPVRIVIICIY